MSEQAKLCSKCKVKPRADADSNNPWCLECRAKYMRAYKATLLEQQGGKGFGKGVAEMRDVLAREFERLGSSGFSGSEVAYLIRQAPGPVPTKES